MNCKRCPEIEYAPQTAEGRAVADILARQGIWKRGGMNGGLTGLDLPEAMASLSDELDRDLARRLFIAAENPYLAAWWAAQPKPKEE